MRYVAAWNTELSTSFSGLIVDHWGAQEDPETGCVDVSPGLSSAPALSLWEAHDRRWQLALSRVLFGFNPEQQVWVPNAAHSR